MADVGSSWEHVSDCFPFPPLICLFFCLKCLVSNWVTMNWSSGSQGLAMVALDNIVSDSFIFICSLNFFFGEGCQIAYVKAKESTDHAKCTVSDYFSFIHSFLCFNFFFSEGFHVAHVKVTDDIKNEWLLFINSFPFFSEGCHDACVKIKESTNDAKWFIHLFFVKISFSVRHFAMFVWK